jgi:hypothetical protein
MGCATVRHKPRMRSEKKTEYHPGKSEKITGIFFVKS